MNRRKLLALAAGLLSAAILAWWIVGPAPRPASAPGPVPPRPAASVPASAPSVPGTRGANRDPAPNAASPRLGAAAVPLLPAGYVASLVREARAQVAAERPELSPALDQIESPETEARAEAVRTLGFAEERRLLPLITAVLVGDAQAEVRAAAAASLDIHDAHPEASRALVRALDDPATEVREDALLSLKAHRNEVVQKELRSKIAGGVLPPEVATEVKLFLDRYYVRKDPFKNPLEP